MKSFLLLPAIALVAAMNFSSANADIVAEYNFDSGSVVSTDTSEFSIASNYDTRSTAFANNVSGISAGNEEAFIRASGTPNSSNPDTSNAFHTFSIEVTGLADGATLDLTLLEFDYFVDPFPNNANVFTGVYSDLVGLDSTEDRLSVNTSFNSNNIDRNDPARVSIGLTPGTADGDVGFAGTEFVGLTNGDVAEFRIQFGDANSSFNNIQRIDSIALSGTVVAATVATVPEPSSIALLGLGGIALLARRRK